MIVERRRLIRELLESSPRPTGAHIVRMLRVLDDGPDRELMNRREFLDLVGQELGWRGGHGSTYHAKYYRTEPVNEDVPVAFTAPDDDSDEARLVEPFPTSRVRDTLRESVEAAVEWYLTRSVPVPRERFLRRGGIADAGRGVVYSYHCGRDDEYSDDGRGDAVYVGITGDRVKSRLTTHTSPHKRSAWWNEWTYMRFVPMEAIGDRQILEYLLILGLAPSFNRRPAAVDIDRFLSD